MSNSKNENKDFTDVGTHLLLNTNKGGLVKAWTKGVNFEDGAKKQLINTANLPFIHKWIAVMPDVHQGLGATIGSVVPTKGAIIPAAVGVDIGCGMMALKTSLTAEDLPDSLKKIRTSIEKAVPHGRTAGGGRRDQGSWGELPNDVAKGWRKLNDRFDLLCNKHKRFIKTNNSCHLGTLGTGNHFIEICLDEEKNVWIMLHSGSRGVGNCIGTYFIEKAKKDMERHFINLPDKDLSYLSEGSEHFDDYVEAVEWAQDFARVNREVMMKNVIKAMQSSKGMREFKADLAVVNCHHNYIAKEHHYGEDVWVTRKGAVRAKVEDWGIIPGSMGACSYIVKGKGNAESFHSCSHGAGRVMSRTKAKKMFTTNDQIKATEGVECRKDESVIDEIPMAYKEIDKVMEAQKELVDIKYKLKQIVCVKG
ncbi:MAG: RNA-splicing ligase RtcB [Planctomycetota bacterium]|nr:MAG: RNA-splicing ligase RtcB [Planctomycetota bacterium]